MTKDYNNPKTFEAMAYGKFKPMVAVNGGTQG